MMDSRLDQAKQWLTNHFKYDNYSISLLSGDASFRRYFRVIDHQNETPFVLMDAPPEKEDTHPFLAIAHSWRNQQISAPTIHAENPSSGFLLLEDFGDTTFYQAILPNSDNQTNADERYQQAIDALIPIQFATSPAEYEIPPFDEALLRLEISLFTDWLLTKKLNLALSETELKILNRFFDSLVDCALNQPQVLVHRDYHSRNLMISPDDSLGILDFQDAVMGPITYDLVSLLRDCYIKWPLDQVRIWQRYYLDRLLDFLNRPGARGQLPQHGKNISNEEFTRWFDLVGLQRHLKASGIFARLSLRDGKHGYLNDIPRTVSYLADVTALYSEFSEVNLWLNDRLIPLVKDWGEANVTAFNEADIVKSKET